MVVLKDNEYMICANDDNKLENIGHGFYYCEKCGFETNSAIYRRKTKS